MANGKEVALRGLLRLAQLVEKRLERAEAVVAKLEDRAEQVRKLIEALQGDDDDA